ncbi:MAG: polyphosphate kinase 2 [Flammeovirgaceae bacterium]|nr:polyphosphate kinase 2 [Flammeovirgaceae bacterium]
MAFHSLETDPVYINLQTEMVSMQRWVMENNKRIVIIFEGRDTAGKGGAIMRFVRFINPRGYRVVAKPKPTETERGQWYFQRYIKELPDPGQIVFFDRSWYNRAVVEPVMGFCTKPQYQEFLEQVVALEKMLINDGIILIKFWFSIDVEEQKNRLENRKIDPLKQWKLSTVDMQAQQKWDDFTKYKEKMFEKTGTPLSPWVVIKGNDRDNARLEAIRYVLNKIDYPEKGITKERLTPDPEIINLQINK